MWTWRGVTRHDFLDERCGSCHREHNEPVHMVRRDDGLCVACHAGAIVPLDGAEIPAVSAFTAGDHPAFRLALLRPQGPGGVHGWDVERQRSGDEPASEQSNLKFSHEVHLDPEKVHEPSGENALQCVSCHTLKDDREFFEPITMDANCRSCHRLNFDIFEPELELPHGDLRAAIVAMEAHFIREFTDPALRRERAASKPRRVPGKRESAASCEGSGLECGRAEARKEAQYQFAETGCITCHEVLDTGLADISDRWYVQPVRLADDWYPAGRFDHGSHLSLARVEEGEVCESCHEARGSETAQDVLIPSRELCLDCHAQDQGSSAMDCVACHAFHLPDGTLSATSRGERK